MKKILLYFTLILFVFSSTNFAQSLGATFMVAAPQKDFKKQNDNTGFGLQIQGATSSPGLTNPISFGLSIGYMVFSSKDRNYTTNAGLFEINQKLELSSNMANFHLFLQLSPVPGPIKPYVEVLGGGNLLFTTATAKIEGVDDNYIYDNNLSKDDSFNDFTWSYGAGAGLLISIVPLPLVDVYIDAKVRYLKGGEAEFVTMDDIEVNFEKGAVYFSPRKAFTDVMSYHLGVSVGF